MNWPLFWALALAFGVVIGNVMLVKHSAKLKMPSLRDLEKPSDDAPLQQDATPQAKTTSGQKPNTPE